MADGKLKASAILAAYVTAVVWALNWFLSMINIQAPAQLFGISVPLTTGITPTVGAKILGFINGLVAFDVVSIITLYLSALAIIFVGSFAMDTLPLPKGRDNWQRLALILMYGTIVFYIAIVGLVFGAWMTWFGLAIWYVAVALAVQFVQKHVRI